jgi:hypothetical protein
MSLKNTDIGKPVLVDVVSGEIKPLQWKQGTSDTLESLPMKDSIMVIADESYFDWAVLPEAPSCLNVSLSGAVPVLMWDVHGSDATGIVVERRIQNGAIGQGRWERLANLTINSRKYRDSAVAKGQHVAYRIRAINAKGESAYSNIARVIVPPK